MKFLIACIAILGVASAMPAVSEWTLNQLSHALQDPDTPPAAIPYLEAALNELMMQIMTGTAPPNPAIVVTLPPGVAGAIPDDIISIMPVLPGIIPDDIIPVMPVLPGIIPDDIVSIMPVMPVLPPGIVDVSPVLPESPVNSEQNSSPMVQIILNIAA